MNYSLLLEVLVLMMKFSVSYEFTSNNMIPSDCKRETTKISSKSSESVVWPNSKNGTTNVLSQPLCLDSNKLLIRRSCLEEWIPKHVNRCDFIQQSFEDNIICPEQFHPISGDNISLCVKVTSPGIWSNHCLSSGSTVSLMDLNDDERKVVEAKLEVMNITKIWVPFRRRKEYDPIVQCLPGPNWGSTVIQVAMSEMKLIQQESIHDKCVLYDIHRRKYITKNCMEHYPMLCVFKGSYIIETLYPFQHFTTRFIDRQDTLFAIAEIQPSSWYFSEGYKTPEINSAEKNFIYKKIMHETARNSSEERRCWIGLSKTLIGQFIWASNMKTLSFVNWNKNTNFNSVIGVFNEDATWELVNELEKLSCILIETEQKATSTAELLLNFNGNGSLELSVYSPEGLWRDSKTDPGFRCFTDATGDLIHSVDIEFVIEGMLQVVVDINNRTISLIARKYKLEVLENGPGYYWCEGHKMKSFELVRTSRLYSYNVNSTRTFAAVLQINRDVCLDCDEAHKINDKLGAVFSDYSDIMTNIRLMQILNITDNNVKLLAHFEVVHDEAVGQSNLYYQLSRYFEMVNKLNGSINLSENIRMLSVTHIQYCISEKLSEEYVVEIGDIRTPSEICLQKNGLPVFSKCVGDALFGVTWFNTNHLCDNINDKNLPVLTQRLFDLAFMPQNEYPTELFILILNQIKNEALSPTDIYYVSKILADLMYSTNKKSKLDCKILPQLIKLVSTLSALNRSVVKLSQATLNAATSILLAMNTLLNNIVENCKINEQLHREALHFNIQVSIPRESNITGFGLVQSQFPPQTNLQDFEILPLTANQSLVDLVNRGDLHAAIWIPHDFLKDIYKTTNPHFKIITSVFYDDTLFQDGFSHSKDFVSGPVLGMSIPGVDKHLHLPVLVLFRSVDNVNSRCVYWKLDKFDPEKFGTWSEAGCKLFNTYTTGNTRMDLCVCYHLDHIALMNTISPSTDEISNFSKDREALDLVTNTGSLLSLFGITGIFVTALKFKSWRKRAGTKILIQLSLSVSLQILGIIFLNMYQISISTETMKREEYKLERIICTCFGAVMHFSILSSFSWMVVIAVFQYKRYVTVLGVTRPSHFLLKTSFFGYGFPILVVSVTLYYNLSCYIPSRSSAPVLYPSHWHLLPKELFIGLFLPAAIMFAINLFLFSIIFFNIVKAVSTKPVNSKDVDLNFAPLKFSILMFFVLGFTWSFGFLQIFLDPIWLTYCFCSTVSSQGFVLFIYFVVLNPITQELWINYFKK